MPNVALTVTTNSTAPIGGLVPPDKTKIRSALLLGGIRSSATPPLHAGQIFLSQSRDDAGTPGIPRMRIGFCRFPRPCVSATWRLRVIPCRDCVHDDLPFLKNRHRLNKEQAGKFDWQITGHGVRSRSSDDGRKGLARRTQSREGSSRYLESGLHVC